MSRSFITKGAGAPLNSVYKAGQEKSADHSRSGARAAFFISLDGELAGLCNPLLLGLRISPALFFCLYCASPH